MTINHSRPLWQEGMFLAPQHLQQADNFRDEVEGLFTYAQLPCPWGIESIEIDENLLPNFQFAIHQLTAISSSKEALFFPGNIEIPSRTFEGVLSDPQQRVLVYLGIPDYQRESANLSSGNGSSSNDVGRYRYHAEDMPLMDENTGLSERVIQTRKIRGKILFEGEDVQGFQILPIARIKPASNLQGAVLDETYIPPILKVSSSPTLQKMLNGIAATLTTVQSNLQRAMGSKGVLEWCSTSRGVEAVLKIQAVNQVLFSIQQISHAIDISPFTAYSELLRTIGTFWAFKGAHPLERAPFYNHLKLGENFITAIDILRKLCAILDTQGYIRREFVPHHGRMEVDLDDDWLNGDRKLYLCVLGAGEYNEVIKKMAAIRVCAPSHFVQVLQRRIQAIQFQWMRQPPSSLPATKGAVYAEIIQSGRFWPGVVTERAIAVGSSEPFPARLDLFVE